MAIFRIPEVKPKYSEDDKQDHIDDFERDTGIEVIDNDVDSLSELEDEFDDLNQMTYKQRKISNAKSLEIYGYDNVERYNKLKSKFLKTSKYNEPIRILPESVILMKNNNTNTMEDIESKVDEAREWSANSLIEIITPQKTNIELDALWNKWNLMHKKLRKVSDDKCISLFGKTNKEFYEYLKSYFLRSNQVIDDTIEKINTNLSLTTGMVDDLKINLESTTIKSCNVNGIFDTYDNIPYFIPDDLYVMGVFNLDTNYYGCESDNKYLDSDNKISVKSWFNDYRLYSTGFSVAKMGELTSLWIQKLNTLYRDYDYIKEHGSVNMINARKQSILELGWNPEIPFSLENRKLATEMNRVKLKESIDVNIYNLQDIYNEANELKELGVQDKYPVYIVFNYNEYMVSKAIRKFTNGKYSHTGISLDSDLKRIYSFNTLTNGFSLESIDKYKKTEVDDIAVFVAFVNKKELQAIKAKLDYFIANKKETSYSFLNIFGILADKDFESETSMICSQFVDRLLKSVNKDITKKPSGLVTPNDIYVNSVKSLYKVYEGSMNKYNSFKTNSTIKKILSPVLNENSKEGSFIYYINEAKEFPVQFDQEGNLLIKNMKRLDFESEYSQSHKLLIIYDNSNNLEGLKYEISKLWFLNLLLEKKIYNEKHLEKTKKELYKVRARVLNDFNKYLNIIISRESDFNFTDYYNNSPFSDATIKINKSTLKTGAKIVKSLSLLV